MKWLLFVILTGVFLPLLGQIDTSKSISWWVKADANNSFKYSFTPPLWGSTNPNIPNRPVGVHSSSLFGYALSGGFSRAIRDNLHFDIGMEFLFHRRNYNCDVDSIQKYFDSTGVELAYNIDAFEASTQICIAVKYSVNRFSFALGTKIPAIILNSFEYTYNSGISNFTSHQWLWDCSFPSVWLNCSIGYKILPRLEIYGSYNWFTSSVFLYKRDFSLGCRYRFS